ncbi:primosomal replication protein N [Burkholderiales bacterium]|nr:primosomal replication protein N [Burkholderiales bacterium]
MSTNSIKLFATISVREVLRYSPSGIPILKFSVEHSSEQTEEKSQRRVMLNLDCVAFGEKAVELDRFIVGQQLSLFGFLMNKGARSKWPIFNVQGFDKN